MSVWFEYIPKWSKDPPTYLFIFVSETGYLSEAALKQDNIICFIGTNTSSVIADACFFKWAFPGLFFFIFVFSIQLIVNKKCRWLDSNCGSLVSEATALPTEPQPLPLQKHVWMLNKSIFEWGEQLSIKFQKQIQNKTFQIGARERQDQERDNHKKCPVSKIDHFISE